MKVSLNWLRELVEFDKPVDDLAESLSMAGFEVEGIQDLSASAKGVFLGLVESCEKHPNADKLSICKVNIGSSSLLNIVCGAQNVKKGIHVAVAIEDTFLPAKNLKIKSSEIRGVPSNGMICSFEELGLDIKSEGIAVISDLDANKWALGTPITSLLGLDDIVLDLAITANRPDGMSMVGIAQEVSALTSRELNIPLLREPVNVVNKEINIECGNDILKNNIYSLTLIEGVDGKIKSCGKFNQRLNSSGMRTMNLIVDITNFVMIEQGQPLHAFDADILDQIAGRNVSHDDFSFRNALQNEEFVTLDGNTIKLTSSCIVLTCCGEIISLPGIIGGLKTGITEKTKRIWVESAVFTPKQIRENSRAIGIRTESSSRFEKGVPREMTLKALGRLLELIESEFETTSTITYIHKQNQERTQPIILRKKSIKKLLGPLNILTKESKSNHIETQIKKNGAKYTQSSANQFLTDNQIETALKSVGCKLNKNDGGWDVTVLASRKLDLKREVDLIEEIARLIGYDKFEANIPDPIKPGLLNPKQQAERNLRNYLSSSGLQEVTTSSLVPHNPKVKEMVGISNPLLAETSHMRTNMWEEHIQICKRNLANGQKGCWLYEIGSIYFKEGEEISIVDQLAGIISGERRLEVWTTNGKAKKLNFYEARGLLSVVLASMKVEVSDLPLTNDPILHPGRASELIIEGRQAGRFGQLHPDLTEKSELPSETYLFDINLGKLLESATRQNKWITTFKEFPNVPYMERDLSLIVPKDISSVEIIKTIRKAGKPLLEKVELIDRFDSDTIEKGKCSQAFRIRYRSLTKTLTEDDITPIHDKIRASIIKEFDVILRS